MAHEEHILKEAERDAQLRKQRKIKRDERAELCENIEYLNKKYIHPRIARTFELMLEEIKHLEIRRGHRGYKR